MGHKNQPPATAALAGHQQLNRVGRSLPGNMYNDHQDRREGLAACWGGGGGGGGRKTRRWYKRPKKLAEYESVLLQRLCVCTCVSLRSSELSFYLESPPYSPWSMPSI